MPGPNLPRTDGDNLGPKCERLQTESYVGSFESRLLPKFTKELAFFQVQGAEHTKHLSDHFYSRLLQQQLAVGTVVFGGKQLLRGGRSRFVSCLLQTPHIVTVIINSILIDIKTVLNYSQAFIIIVVLCISVTVHQPNLLL